MEPAVNDSSDRLIKDKSNEWAGLTRSALVLFGLLTLITGVAYPLAVTLIAQIAFPQAAAGSVIRDGAFAVGSELIGQPFENPRYFWGRPSATTPSYNGMGGSGSNQATTNPARWDSVKERIEHLRRADPENSAAIPVDLITASASGLDPHISPAAADFQAARVSRLRGIPLERVRSLIEANTQGPTMGFLGQPRVHILRLNRDLDSEK